MGKKQTYVLESDEVAVQRLVYQHSFYQQPSKQLVIKTFIKNKSDFHIAYTMFNPVQDAGLTIKTQKFFSLY